MTELRDPRFVGTFTAITTPFTQDGGAIDFVRLEEQIAFQAQGGVAGIVVCGTTGESPTLSETEYRELVERAIEIGRAHSLLVIAGTGSNSTAHAVELHRFAANAGADGSLSVNPYYNKPTQDGLYAHFAAIAEAGELPVVLYNIPGRTGVALSPETIERLARHESIVAVKDATGTTETANVVTASCPMLALLSGDDAMTLPFGSLGGVGVVSVIANLVPREMAALTRLIGEGRFGNALEQHRRLVPLCGAMGIETNPIPVKAAMALVGRDSGAMRLPMTAAREGTIEKLRPILKNLGLGARSLSGSRSG
jgi:4-hydroxy-tetrahydrodipicolinate synthase